MTLAVTGTVGSDDTSTGVQAPSRPGRRAVPRALGRGGSAVASVALFLLCWQLLSWRVSADVLPGPGGALEAVRVAADSGYLWSDMRVTTTRIGGAFTLSMLAAIVAGTALGRSPLLARMFGWWVTFVAAVPSLLVVVVVYLAVGLNDRAAILAAAIVVWPSVTFNVWQGVRGLDPELSEMARAFGVPATVAIRRVTFPQTLPFLFAAARSGLALVWKITIFVELLGRSSGVGYRIQFWYSLFDMQRVIGVAVPFITLMLAIEFALLRPLEARLFRWRPAESS